jgi:hypothetical protein
VKRLKPDEQRRRILELWLERNKNRRTGDDVLVFYGWLSEHEPDLLPEGSGSYKQLRKIVSEHLIEPGQ